VVSAVPTVVCLCPSHHREVHHGASQGITDFARRKELENLALNAAKTVGMPAVGTSDDVIVLRIEANFQRL
jgi:hypothetical protein